MPTLGAKVQRFVSMIKHHSLDLSYHYQHHEMDDLDECEPPRDVPKGCLAVYVGSQRQRFVVSTRFLSNPVFRVLLDRAEEEYGFVSTGALTIPCEAVLFEHLVWLLRRNDPAAARIEVDELLNFYDS